ncbi:MAG: hypothetical protein SPE23_00685, partial [Sodaliphilus sp.]|nr:hypothetical protein [Sodaliphilus sp.]
NASPPNARTPPATKKRTPPIIESWECPYVISKKNGNIAPLPTFSVLSPKACPYDLGVIWVEKSPDLIHYYPIFTCFLVMIGF